MVTPPTNKIKYFSRVNLLTLVLKDTSPVVINDIVNAAADAASMLE